jgi:hypothetical protein
METSRHFLLGPRNTSKGIMVVLELNGGRQWRNHVCDLKFTKLSKLSFLVKSRSKVSFQIQALDDYLIQQ